MKRRRIPRPVSDAVINSQGDRCAMCGITHPLQIHHITPVHLGGTNDPSNLMALCPNHHDFADSGVLPPALLGFYKRSAHFGNMDVGEPTAVYEVTADRVVNDLLVSYNPQSLELARNLVQRLGRARDPRHRRIWLQFVYGVIHASMHELHGKSVDSLRPIIKLVERAEQVAKDLGEEGLVFLHLLPHYLGVLHHNVGNYREAKASFQQAVAVAQSIKGSEAAAGLSDELELAQVRETASDYLSGAAEHSLDLLRSIMDKMPEDQLSVTNAYCFGSIKLAEHMIVRDLYDRAVDILEKTLSSPVMARVQPLFRVIALKDLGIAYVRAGDRPKGTSMFLKAATIAESGGFEDQLSKILEAATELRIAPDEIGLLP